MSWRRRTASGRTGRRLAGALGLVALWGGTAAAFQAVVVPTDVQEPGTQPQEIPDLISPLNCDNCHSNYNETAVEPAHNWRGSMMAHASVDPLFWATVAVSEQDFEGSGDLCLRCHVGDGWIAGRSTPTDGSALTSSDATGVSCHLCHVVTNPDGLEIQGVQNAPYLANDEGMPPIGYYGSGMFVLWPGNDRLGPYDDADAAPHSFMQSVFHRSVDFCGTCHDVSNPVVGDLAHNHGAMTLPLPGASSGVPGSPVDGKAAFNNFPYAYGIVERTFSEYKASRFPTTLVSLYLTEVPADLQRGAIAEARDAALSAGMGGDYADGTDRFFSCQTCHMRAVQGHGCKQNQAPLRADLPLHDQTGGNYWMPDVLAYLDGQLVLKPSLSSAELAALPDGKARALHNLEVAAALEVTGDTVRVTNLTGHKLISGYPEGRRMWLNVVWEDDQGGVLREDGAYGPLAVDLDGSPTMVDTLLDLHDPYVPVYAAHYGMTQEWAAQLLALGYPSGLVLAWDRVTGLATATLGDLAAQVPGTAWETFHFALNNVVVSDDRIPPWGMGYDAAQERNALPVPDDQYGDPGAGGTYEHWDEVVLQPPPGAATATVRLLYQPTSWEYVQFLHLANDGTGFLAATGADLLDAWLNTGMAAPAVMATETWTAPFPDCNGNGVDDADDIAGGTSLDCNANGVPDDCDPDGDGNGIPDECDGGVGTLSCFGVGCPCANDDPAAGCATSTGAGALLTGSGSASVAADDLVLSATGVPPNNQGLCYMGDTPVHDPFFDGFQCALGTTFRFLDSIQNSGGSGTMSYDGVVAASGLITAGSTWYFHFWFRDVPGSPCGTGANLTNLLGVTFGP